MKGIKRIVRVSGTLLDTIVNRKGDCTRREGMLITVLSGSTVGSGNDYN